ncbi:MAG: hypothetical protein QNK23_04280 [Crocinitomicaceae bacterium]|nr:hypothetical protein [Crocinitomicaceae bacterium]
MKVNQKKLGMMIVAASLTLGTVSCKKEGCTDGTATNYNSEADKDDGSCTYAPAEGGIVVEKTGYIYSDQTWVSDSIYHITGKVIVETGATLTIMPCTIVTGAQGSGANASALVIAQGGMINACGTATQPIIFTSELDDIQPGQLTGTNLDENDQGLWGGIIVLGNAPISAADGDNLSQIEGIPATDTYGAFGGSDASDNSGSMCYVSIRHGGALIGAGNEINGLTLGGVGSGTSISNIEVVSNLDDGIEFFGGTVDVSNVLVGWQGDDGIDIDMNYSGTVSNFTVINGASSDEGLEIDGPEGTTYTSGMFTLQDGTVYTFGGADANGDFKSKAQGFVNNVILGGAKIRASYQNACVDTKTDAFTHLTDASATLTFTGSQFSSVTVYTASDDGAGTACTVFAVDQTAAESAMTSGTATGSDVSGFTSWSWAGVNGKL